MTSCCRRAAVPRLSFWNRMAGSGGVRSIGASLVAEASTIRSWRSSYRFWRRTFVLRAWSLGW